MKVLSVCSLLLALLIVPGGVFAAHPLITDDAGTFGKGVANVEFNLEYEHDKSDGITTSATELSTVLSYGITDAVDLMFTIPYLYVSVKEPDGKFTEDGLSDVGVEVKWRLFEKNGLGFAVKPGVTLPTGDEERGLGTGKVTYSMFLIGTKEIEPLAFHANLGYVRNENKVDERKDIWHASVAAEYQVLDQLALVANIGMDRNLAFESNTPPAFLLGGLIFSLTERVVLDFGVKLGLNDPAPDYAILAGLNVSF
ncbi:transporter [Desulfonatronum parangueonense]